ncbi:MAG TPA: CocE/NonD family hydrolase [Pseudonocardia sp.]|nr:CocE/NonD family hydrolase [Pseudonocardia sp.]
MRLPAASRRSLSVLAVALTVCTLVGVQMATGSDTARAATVPDPVRDAIAASGTDRDWTPAPERYGVKEVNGVGVRMSDGTVLRATVAYPADQRTGEIAPGRFPTLLTITPYGAAFAVGGATGINPYLVTRGYLDISVDARGTGASGGTFDLFEPKQTQDSVELVHWAAELPRSDGKVGMHGASYLGINQLFAASAVGKDSPLKAIFPIVAANDIYRDAAFMGGIPDLEFDTAYFLGVLPATNLVNPLLSAMKSPAHLVEGVTGTLNHALQIPQYNVQFLAKAYLGGPNAYDNSYWADRRPASVLRRIVANDIPAYLVGGEYDLFQRGAPMNYAGLQNAYAGRPTTEPMDPDQDVTGRYQLLQGPYTHLGGAANSMLNELQLRWFDQWLKGEDSGMDRTETPLHAYDLGTGRYTETTSYPLPGATPTTYYFGGGRSGSAISVNDGTLSTGAPSSNTGSDTVLWSPVAGTLCGRSQDQWAAGALSLVTNQIPANVPCVDDDRLAQTGPTSLTYTTGTLENPKTIAGPISATVYATANTRDTEWVVNIADVAPDGVSRPLTQGALLGSFRAVNRDRSWTMDDKTVMPYHDYTKQSVEPVLPGQLTRYDIEVFPTFATIAPGHRIRLTLATADLPHLLPTAPALANLVGGVYQVRRGGSAASSVTIPLRDCDN